MSGARSSGLGPEARRCQSLGKPVNQPRYPFLNRAVEVYERFLRIIAEYDAVGGKRT
jgi:hypothetical protein